MPSWEGIPLFRIKQKMKKYWYIILIAVAAVTALCILYLKQGKQTAEEAPEPSNSGVPMQVSQYDTVTVLSLAKEYLNYVMERNYDAAVGMLYVLDENNLPVTLSAEQRQKQLMAMKLYPVYGYEIDKLIFWRQTDSRLDYYIQINQPTDGSEPARVRCALRPVRYADVWYLTLADDREMRDNSEIKL